MGGLQPLTDEIPDVGTHGDSGDHFDVHGFRIPLLDEEESLGDGVTVVLVGNHGKGGVDDQP